MAEAWVNLFFFFGSQQQKSIISEVWRPEVQTQGAGRATLPWRFEGNFPPCFFPFLAAPGGTG